MSIPGRRKSMCKGPEVGACLKYLSLSKQARRLLEWKVREFLGDRCRAAYNLVDHCRVFTLVRKSH